MSSTKFVARHGINSLGDLIVTGSITATGGISISGSIASASFATSASQAQNAVSSSFALTASYAANVPQTASFAISASQAQNATSSSFALTSSFANNFTVAGTLTAQTLVVQTITSSIIYSSGSNIFGNDLANTQVLTGSVTVTGSLAVNNSNVILTNQTSSMSVATASFAISASQAQNAVSSSFATTASFAVSASYVPGEALFPYTGSAIISGSLQVTGSTSIDGELSVAPNEYQVLYVHPSGVDITGSLVVDSDLRINANMYMLADKLIYGTASYALSSSYSSGSLTGSLSGTASFATSASQAQNAVSSSYALTASFASNVPQTASFAISASQAQNAVSSSFAFTASYAENAGGGAGFPFSGSAVITGSLQITNLTGSGTRYVVADSGGNLTSQQPSSAILSTQTVTASAGQTSFNITNGYTTGLINVFVNGTKLNESEYVDTNGTSITFLTASMLNDVVEFQRYLPALGVTNNALRSVNYFTAIVSQSVFSASYTPGLLDVFYNGSKLSNTDYTANDGSTITLATASSAGDIIEVDVYSYQVGAFNGIGGEGTLGQISYFNTSNSITGSPNFTISGSTMTVTGSLLVTGSGTFTNIGPAIFSGSVTAVGGFTGSFSGTASNATSASQAQNAVSSSYALTASFAANVPQTASFAISASQAQNATSASFATTASYALNALSASSALINVSGSNVDNIQTDQAVSSIQFDSETGLNVDLVSGSTAFISIGSHYKFIYVSGSPTLVATGSDEFTAVGQGGIEASTSIIPSGSGEIKNLIFSAATMSSSLSSRINTIVENYATTGSNTFTGAQYISNTTDATSFTSTAALYTDGGLRVTKDAFVSGGLSIAGNLTVFGTSSVNFVTSSTLIGLEFINLNTDLPALRYAGINVGDSGSAAGISSSFWYDSEKDNWLYVYAPPTSGEVTSSMAINGPIAYNNIGNEQGLLGNYIVKSQLITAENNHHITSSQIYDDGTTVAIAGNLQVTGSLRAGSLTGSLFGTATTASFVTTAQTASFVLNAVSASFATSATTAQTASFVLNAVSASFALTASTLAGGIPQSFPFTGSAIITGSLGVTGSVGLSYLVTSTTAWSAGNAMITARCGLAGAGTQNAALAFGGGGIPAVACTEAYNGTSWTAGGAMITARTQLAGAGTNTAALAFGGLFPNVACTETYNGTSWSAGGAMITARACLAGAGASNTAALAFGGRTPSNVACTETYNGTAWTAGGAMITARQRLGGAGTNTAALAFGGYTPSVGRVACTEAYNGTSWSAGGAMIIARQSLAGAGASNTAALAFGGYTPSAGAVACTEAYNGTSWSADNTLSTARTQLAGEGTRNNALAFGGDNSGAVACTEAYNAGSTTLTKTFDYSNTTGQISATGSLFGTATSASFALNAVSASFATSAANATTASFVLNAVSASFATTASFALNSAGGGGGAAFPFTGSAQITGSLTVIGTTTTTTLVETSALRYKENIQDLETADSIYKLRPVTFNWKDTLKSDIGFIAEEVNEILPVLAELNENGEAEGVKYSKLTVLLTKIAQIQEQKLEAQQKQIDELKQEIENLKNK